MRQYVYPLRGGGVILSNLEFAPSVDNRSVILSNYFLPSQTGKGAEGGWGDAEPPQTKTVSLLPGWEKVPKADEGGTGTKKH